MLRRRWLNPQIPCRWSLHSTYQGQSREHSRISPHPAVGALGECEMVSVVRQISRPPRDFNVDERIVSQRVRYGMTASLNLSASFLKFWLFWRSFPASALTCGVTEHPMSCEADFCGGKSSESLNDFSLPVRLLCSIFIALYDFRI
jgi:hypothetical protein